MIVLYWVVQVYIVICILRIALSWLDMKDGSSILGSIGTISYAVTEPVFAAVRSRMPGFGDLPIDFSPTIVLLVLFVLRAIFGSLA